MMTKKQLAEYLQVSVMTIDRMILKGLPIYKTIEGNGAIRFELNEVKEWLRNNTKKNK